MNGTGGAVITGTLILAALSLKGTDLIKYSLNLLNSETKSRGEALNGLITLLLGGVVGIVVVVVMAQTQWGDEIPIGSERLDKLGGGSLVVLGLTISSFASTLYDLKKAVDRTDSASTPAILPSVEKDRQANLEVYFSNPSGGR
jgi:hypothetical protein